ncbi:hypothetical protein NDU88_005516 [Pleurodeles waltl]|uniref:Uncharacterized protein n=1 Tax=Pleurodeles waltl TaxID=8319 RepID=A0AAV7SLW7_PLEWA|nr:hypothetical protein NDU88_005516 [Pleurodeles waltl]
MKLHARQSRLHEPFSLCSGRACGGARARLGIFSLCDQQCRQRKIARSHPNQGGHGYGGSARPDVGGIEAAPLTATTKKAMGGKFKMALIPAESLERGSAYVSEIEKTLERMNNVLNKSVAYWWMEEKNVALDWEKKRKLDLSAGERSWKRPGRGITSEKHMKPDGHDRTCTRDPKSFQRK